jgi:hypothetical protein
MADVFISYAEENRSIAEQLGNEIPRLGYSTWLYHRDSIPGLLHLETTRREIESATVVMVLVSRASLHSDFVFPELLHAVSLHKHLLPVLIDVTHRDIEGEKPKWAAAIGFAVAVSWGDGDTARFKISKGLELLIRGRAVQDYTGVNDRRQRPAAPAPGAPTPAPIPQLFHANFIQPEAGCRLDN